jgi:hypothetical protein
VSKFKPRFWFSSLVIVATARLIATVGRIDANMVKCSAMYLFSTKRSRKLVMKKKRVLVTLAKVTLSLKNDCMSKIYPNKLIP